MKYHLKKYPAAVVKRREDVRRQRAEAKAKIKVRKLKVAAEINCTYAAYAI